MSAFRDDHLVGILGGMGPAATADFYAKLIARTPATRDQDHLRVAIWADPTVPDRVADVLAGNTEPPPALLTGAHHLRTLGATIGALPCHTAHAYLPSLTAHTGLPFIDMTTETAKALTPRAPTRVGLLATQATLAAGLYQRHLPTHTVITPTPQTQPHVDAAIAAVKQGNLPAAATHLAAALPDTPVTILACTELPLAAAHLPGDHPELLDPTDLLADAIREACR